MSAGEGGRTLIGLLQALALAALLLGLGAASLAPAARGREAEAAARALAGRLQALRTRALAEGRSVALVFPQGSDEPFREAVDGNADGLHRDDVERGADPAGGPLRLAADVGRTRVARPPWPSMSDVPPGSGRLAPGEPAARCGSARMIVFDVEGHATPATVFVGDGERTVCAVVVHGATARTRTWCYERRTDTWHSR